MSKFCCRDLLRESGLSGLKTQKPTFFFYLGSKITLAPMPDAQPFVVKQVVAFYVPNIIHVEISVE